MRGLEQTNESCFGSASPSSRRNTGADLESYGQMAALRHVGCCSGAEETRTPDFLLAKEALYQLSYGPEEQSAFCASYRGIRVLGAVGVCGLEPQTSALSGQCSNQLS